MRISNFIRVLVLGVILLCVLCDSVVSQLDLEESPSGSADSPRLQQTPPANQPIPLPSRAEPVSDRASLDDPTLAASTAATTAAPIPPRTRKAPLLKTTVPDPYDHRRTAMPALEESKDLPFDSPQTPRH